MGNTTKKQSQNPKQSLSVLLRDIIQKRKSNENVNNSFQPHQLDGFEGDIMKIVQYETNGLRMKILRDIPIEFLTKTVVILYGPPKSDVKEISSFLKHKLNFKRFTENDFPSAESSDDNPPPPEERLKDFFTRIQREDCEQGFILVNSPRTVVDGEAFNWATKNYKKVVLFVDHDYNKLLKKRCSRWIHVASGRKYDTYKKPPHSMQGDPDNPTNMKDDETGEELVQVVDKKQYRMELRAYSKMVTVMRTYYAHSAMSTFADRDVSEIKNDIVTILCRVIANQPKPEGRRPFRATADEGLAISFRDDSGS